VQIARAIIQAAGKLIKTFRPLTLINP